MKEEGSTYNIKEGEKTKYESYGQRRCVKIEVPMVIVLIGDLGE